MDASASLHGYESSFCSWSCQSSDSEFYSMSSPETISPSPSMDLVFSSPSKCSDFGKPDQFARLESHKSTDRSPTKSGRPIRTRTRSKNPSKQRQSASEKEKLRMRDLTKALHHLRTYLPASVAPVGQTLTKIETLRLTIRYIAHLSAQLGLSEETLFKRKESASLTDASCQDTQEFLGYFQCTPTSAVESPWAPCQDHMGTSPFTAQQYQTSTASGLTTQGTRPVDLSPYGSSVEMPAQNEVFNSGMGVDYLLQTTHSMQTAQACQMYSRDFACQLVPQQYWS